MDGSFTFLEVVPVVVVTDGDLVLPLPLNEFHTLIRKKRVAVSGDFRVSGSKTISKSVVNKIIRA